MFKKIENLIPLAESHIYFLAKELNLTRTVATGIDFTRLSKQEQNELRQSVYDHFRENKVLNTDFFGNATIRKDYAEIVRMFENPDYVCCVAIVDYKNKKSVMKKVYFSNNKWFGLDYSSNGAFVIGELDDVNDAKIFALKEANMINETEPISENDIDNTYTFDNINAVVSKIVIVDEFYKRGEEYFEKQCLYTRLKDGLWADLDSADGVKVQLKKKDMSEIAFYQEG